MPVPAAADRSRRGLSRRQALAGFGISLAVGVSGSVASARAAVAPARDTRAGLAVGLTNAQLAGQRVIASYPGLTPPAALFTDISNGQVAGVIFFGENISSQSQIAGVVTQLRQARSRTASRTGCTFLRPVGNWERVARESLLCSAPGADLGGRHRCLFLLQPIGRAED